MNLNWQLKPGTELTSVTQTELGAYQLCFDPLKKKWFGVLNSEVVVSDQWSEEAAKRACLAHYLKNTSWGKRRTNKKVNQTIIDLPKTNH